MDLNLQSLNTAQEVSGSDKMKEFQKHFDEDSLVEGNFADGEDSESSDESESIADFDSIEDSKSIDNSESINNSESIEDSESSEENQKKIIEEGKNEKQSYREPKTNLSEDENISSSDIDSSSDSDPGAFLDTIHKSPVTNKLVNMKTKGEIDLDDLPPVEDLHISVQKNDLVKIGVVWAIHDRLVSVLSSEDTPTLNFESVLFIAPDKPLGKVYDIFGPVRKPFYAVRFNSIEDITEKCLAENADIFYAPGRSDLVCYVPVDELRKQKGSDASWKDNNEPPEEYLDYSDDEQERAAKQKRRAKGRRETLPDEGISFVPPKIADRRQDVLKSSMPHSRNGSTNSVNSYAEFHPPQQRFSFRPPQKFVPMQRQNLFRPPQSPVPAFYSQSPSQSPVPAFYSQPPSEPPVPAFSSRPPSQPPVSAFYPQPSPQPPVSAFYPQPSPQPPVSAFYSQPSPQPPVSAFYSQPSPQASVSTFYSQPSPQASVSTFYSQPPPSLNSNQSSRVPVQPRQVWGAHAMPAHQQPVFGHLPFRVALRPTMSPPVPSILYATPQLFNCATLPVIPCPTPPAIPSPTPPLIPSPVPPTVHYPTPPVIHSPVPPVIPSPTQHLIHFPPPMTLSPRLPGGYHGFNGPRTINTNWPQGQSFPTVSSNSAVMQPFQFRSPVPVDGRNPTPYIVPVTIYVPSSTSISATPPPQNYFYSQ